MTALQAPTSSLAAPPISEASTVAQLLDWLGGIPPERVRLHPAPGTATEQDVLKINALCELIDGVLVEKTMGIEESLVAAELTFLLKQFVKPRKLGIVAGPDGTIRLLAGQVRLPDVAFFSWDRLPERRAPKLPIPAIAPDLAIEVLSASNTQREMDRKLAEYFDAGATLVWYVDPRVRTFAVYTAPSNPPIRSEGQSVDGGTVLPGLKVDVSAVFSVLDERDPA